MCSSTSLVDIAAYFFLPACGGMVVNSRMTSDQVKLYEKFGKFSYLTIFWCTRQYNRLRGETRIFIRPTQHFDEAHNSRSVDVWTCNQSEAFLAGHRAFCFLVPILTMPLHCKIVATQVQSVSTSWGDECPVEIRSPYADNVWFCCRAGASIQSISSD